MNNYNSHDDIKKFSIELMNRLNTDYSAKINDIKETLEDFTFTFSKNLELQLKNIFINSKQIKGKKEILHDVGVQHVSKKLLKNQLSTTLSLSPPSVNEPEINLNDNTKLFLSEVIFIASLLSTDTRLDSIKECIFDVSRKNNAIKNDFKKLLKYIENDNEVLKSIFIDKITKRFNIKDNNIIFDVITDVLNSMNIQQIQIQQQLH